MSTCGEGPRVVEVEALPREELAEEGHVLPRGRAGVDHDVAQVPVVRQELHLRSATGAGV